MTTLYFVRHAESIANAQHLLAGRKDFPLSDIGKADALALAREFSQHYQIDALWCSPLLRAQQTAAPFLNACNTPMQFDQRLIEQDLGRFSGLSYSQAEADPAYCTERSARWDWIPEGGGESYRMIADRVADFFRDFRETCAQNKLEQVLIVTHAVTMRLIRATLECTLPRYPEAIAGNGELWITELLPPSQAATLQSISLGNGPRSNRA